MEVRSFDDLPDVLTVPEAAAVLRISLHAAYAMARRYRMTNGREGLPVFMAGERTMRIWKVALAEFMAGDLVVHERAPS